MQQTKLSLQLRKRTVERSESVIPPSKRQAKENTDGQISAFGAPHLEERKITKRTLQGKPDPYQKRDTKQTTLEQHTKPLSTPGNSPETDSNAEVGSTSLESSAATNGAILKQQEILHKGSSISTTEIERQDNSASTTTEFESPSISNSPKSSPTLRSRSPKETTASPFHDSQHIDTNDTILPSSPSTMPAQKVSITISPPTIGLEILSKSLSPSTPTVYDKSLSSKLDKGRIIEEERSILDKLVSALDITLTFHAARNVAAFFHKIQPMLRNSTCKNITLSHLCKILFVAPELYNVETKLLKEFGKDTEAHQVSIGSIWTIPLSGKVIEERKDLMTKRSGEYFDKHKETSSTIPEKQLPRLDKVVDKKKWLQNATLPDRVRSVLELQEKRKLVKEEKASQPRIEAKGTAKDRAKALLDRIRNKQKK